MSIKQLDFIAILVIIYDNLSQTYVYISKDYKDINTRVNNFIPNEFLEGATLV